MYEHLNLVDEDIGVLDDHHGGSNESLEKAPVPEEEKKKPDSADSTGQNATSPTRKTSTSAPPGKTAASTPSKGIFVLSNYL